MPTRIVWTRLEPWPRDADLRAGLEARVHDPLWFLARQWQFGEFGAEDAASPVRVAVETGVTLCSSYAPAAARPGATPLSGVAYDPRTTPLEAIAEGEPAASVTEPNWVVAARAGLDLLEAIDALVARDARASVRRTLLREYPIPEPSAADLERWGADRVRGWGMLAKRAPDGQAMYAVLKKTDGTKRLIGLLGTDAPSATALKTPLAAWMATWQSLLAVPTKKLTSWVGERLQYGFSLGVGTGADQIVLAATDHDGGRLDWTSFDVVDGASIKSTAAKWGARVNTTFNAIPSAVQFPGMPNQRYWEFEDGAVNLGAIDASTLDLPRLLFLQFGLMYGNDFFMVPAALPVGSLCATTRFSVFDTFGERREIPALNAVAAPQDAWRMFALAGGNAADGMLWLPAALPASAQGPALELVRMARDESANLTWAIEAVVPGPTGRPVARRDLESRPPSTEPPPNVTNANETLYYHVVALPPPSWVALENAIPKKATDPANVLITTGAGWGRLLAEIRSGRVLHESIPREGVEITRRFEHARWIDGRSVLWMGRSRTIGRGEITSGLKFDFATKTSLD